MLTLDNIEQEIEKYAELSHEHSYTIEIDVEPQSCNGAPQIYVKINDCIYYEEKIETNKTYRVDTFIKKDSICKIVLGMVGKTEKNTLSEGKTIVANQYARIVDIRINKITIVKNHLYFYDHTQFANSDTGEVLHNTDGVYYNGELSLEIPTPIFPFLSKLRQQKVNTHLLQDKNYVLDYGKTISDGERDNLIRTVFD